MLKIEKFYNLSEDEIEILANIHYNHWSQYTNYMNKEKTIYKFKNMYTSENELPIGYALKDENELIGFCILKKKDLESYPDIYPWISDVMIIEKYRYQGYGKKMLDMVTEKIKKLGYAEVYLWTDKAPDFYKKIGFKFKKVVNKNNNEGLGELYYKKI